MVKYEVYLKFRYVPTICTSVYCNNCGKIINAGPNYKPKFCSMCGSPIEDDLDKIEWKDEDCNWIDYAEYVLEEQPDWPIMKIKYESTDYGKIGLPADLERIPVMIGPDIDYIVDYVNQHAYGRYVSDDFEPATKNELIAYAKTCGRFWKG